MFKKAQTGWENEGGLAISVVPELNLVWISEGNDEVEVFVVQVEIEQLKLRLEKKLLVKASTRSGKCSGM